MNETDKLLEIKKQLQKVAEELANIIPSDHPKWNDVFEDVGAASYSTCACYEVRTQSQKLG